MSYVGIGNRQDYIADFPTQEFSGNSTTTAFTLNFEAVTAAIRVAVDNVLQPADGSSYYVNGNTLTFTSAPASGTNNISVVYLGTVRNISSVSDNAITAAKLNSAAITGQTAETTVADDDLVLIYDDSATALRKMTTQNLRALAGITEADQWRLTTSFNATTGSTQVITSNLERVDGSGQGILGTGMTESSGIFTFPSTGIWLVRFGIYTSDNNVWTFCYNKIEVTTNNSTYNNRAFGTTSMTGTMTNYPEQSTLIDTLVDVTDTSNVKVRFTYSTHETISIAGDTDANKTYFTFIRLGDT